MSLPPTTAARSVHSRAATSERPDARRTRAVDEVREHPRGQRHRALDRSGQRAACCAVATVRRAVALPHARLALHLVPSAVGVGARERRRDAQHTEHSAVPPPLARSPDPLPDAPRPGQRVASVGSARMTWLVTGGAGYIGSHVVRAFGQVGLGTVVLDDLSSGHKDFVPGDVPLVQGSILDTRPGRGHAQPARRRRRRAPRGLQVRRRLGQPPAAHLRAERHRHRAPARGDGLAGRRRDRVLVVRRRLRHAGRRPGHRDHRHAPRVALRRVQAHRRVAAGRPGPGRPACGTRRCGTSTSSARPRTTSTTPARTTCSRWSSTPWSPAARRASTAPTTRRPTAPACATTCTSPTSPPRTSRRRRRSRRAARSSPSTTSAPATARPCARS